MTKSERSGGTEFSDASSDLSGSGKLLIFGAIAAIGLLIAWQFLPVSDWITAFQGWIKSLGALGYLVFAVAYIVATLLMLPGSVMTLAAGVALGFWGYPVVVASATAAACLAFLTARYIARKRVEAFVAKKKRFAAVDEAIEEYGWKVVALMRLSPLVPFNLQTICSASPRSTLSAMRSRHCSAICRGHCYTFGSAHLAPQLATAQAAKSEPHNG